MKTRRHNVVKTLLVLAAMIQALASCGTSEKVSLAQNNSGKKNDLYRGKIVLKNKQVIEGYVYIPSGTSKSASVAKYGAEAYTDYKWEEIEYLEAWSAGAPTRKYIFVPTYLYLNKLLSKKVELATDKKRWLVLTAQSPTLSSYIGAMIYGITKSGDLVLTGTSQMGPPSFPIYMKKAADLAPRMVALKGGIVNEASSFRAGVTAFLSDDPDLCEYIKAKKLGTDDIEEIVKRYNPKK